MKAVNETGLIVTIINQSACSTCHASGACTVSDFQDKEIEIADYKGTYFIGQEVNVLFKESKGFTALLYGYVLPFFLVLLSLIISLEVTRDELVSGLISLGVLVPYYFILYVLRDRIKTVFKFQIEEIN